MMEYPCPLHIHKLSLLTEALRHSLERVPMVPSLNQACRPKLNFHFLGVTPNFAQTAFSDVRYRRNTTWHRS